MAAPDPRVIRILSITPTDEEYDAAHFLYRHHTSLGDTARQREIVPQIADFLSAQRQGAAALVCGSGRTLKSSTVSQAVQALHTRETVLASSSPLPFHSRPVDVQTWIDTVIPYGLRPVVHLEEIALDPSTQAGIEPRLEKIVSLIELISEAPYREAGATLLLDVWLPPDPRVFHRAENREPYAYRMLRDAIGALRGGANTVPILAVTMPIHIQAAAASLWHALHRVDERVFWAYAHGRLGMHPAGNTSGNPALGGLVDLYEQARDGRIRDMESFLIAFQQLFPESNRDIFQTPVPGRDSLNAR